MSFAQVLLKQSIEPWCWRPGFQDLPFPPTSQRDFWRLCLNFTRSRINTVAELWVYTSTGALFCLFFLILWSRQSGSCKTIPFFGANIGNLQVSHNLRRMKEHISVSGTGLTFSLWRVAISCIGFNISIACKGHSPVDHSHHIKQCFYFWPY